MMLTVRSDQQASVLKLPGTLVVSPKPKGIVDTPGYPAIDQEELHVELGDRCKRLDATIPMAFPYLIAKVLVGVPETVV